jgi:Ca2+-binding RTX toxin-like protein
MGQDRLYGEAGNDYLDAGNDFMHDYVYGGADSDTFVVYYVWTPVYYDPEAEEWYYDLLSQDTIGDYNPYQDTLIEVY